LFSTLGGAQDGNHPSDLGFFAAYAR
jgi:hypothetical protein